MQLEISLAPRAVVAFEQAPEVAPAIGALSAGTQDSASPQALMWLNRADVICMDSSAG